MKYWQVTKNTWNESLTYRLNFVMWRVRVILQFLTTYLLWAAILSSGKAIGSYNQNLMLGYVLGAWLLGTIVFSNRTQEIAEEINQGNLSNSLLKPFNYFFYWFFKDLGDKAMNIAFLSLELTILSLILKPPIFIQHNIILILLTLFSLIAAILLYFFINILLSFIAFWSPETWAPRFVFYTIIGFTAGEIFPLDILPKEVFSKLIYAPSTYLIYFPLKIYLGEVNYQQIFSGLLIASAWVVLFYLAVKLIWNHGLKLYTAQGR